MACAQVSAMRLKPLRISAVIVRSIQRARCTLSKTCPGKAMFRPVAARLESG